MKQSTSTAHLAVLVAALFCLVAAPAAADPLGDKIVVGLTRDAVVALFGQEPDLETCKMFLGIRSCVLTWRLGFFSKIRYEVGFVADRVVQVEVNAQR